MFKYFLTPAVIFFLLISFSFAEIIKKIQVNGNQRISKETILVLSDLKKNAEYNKDKLNNTLRKLYDSNLASKVFCIPGNAGTANIATNLDL